jgi:hypothetical protein
MSEVMREVSDDLSLAELAQSAASEATAAPMRPLLGTVTSVTSVTSAPDERITIKAPKKSAETVDVVAA